MQPNLVLIRHGQSKFNLENRFAGWIDTDLTTEGEQQAKEAAEVLENSGFIPDVVFISPFTRTRRTAEILVPTHELKADPRLVERFYGGLSGKNKEQTMQEIGDEMFLKIRRGYDTAPPPIAEDHSEMPSIMYAFDKWIKGSFTHVLPATESLQNVETRVKPFYDVLKPLLKSGKKVLIVAHGNSLRALIKIVKNIPPEEIAHVELETAQPTGFVLDSNLNVTADSLGKKFAEAFPTTNGKRPSLSR